MTGILSIFNVLAVVLGPLLRLVYQYLSFGNYLAAILIFVLIVRAATFPLNIKSQKSQCDRARLAPQLARLQKKYGQDRQKMAQKQQELYKKKGVSMTGGCLPQILQIIVLFGIIAVIYKPLTYIANV
ncbi:MAG: YidC/Oxa1 family membrane protein insertase, partial [Oscillospiraceae bacterium]|nr:YidC/Oxa1 family membrane protein insertase [Oscillospiraceae bacterium]